MVWGWGVGGAGGKWDRAAVVVGGPTGARGVLVNGRQGVAEGSIATLEERALARRQNLQMRALQERA